MSKGLMEYVDKMPRIGALSTAGRDAAARLKAAVTLEVEEVRPFNDMGRGWEQSI